MTFLWGSCLVCFFCLELWLALTSPLGRMFSNFSPGPLKSIVYISPDLVIYTSPHQFQLLWGCQLLGCWTKVLVKSMNTPWSGSGFILKLMRLKQGSPGCDPFSGALCSYGSCFSEISKSKIFPLQLVGTIVSLLTSCHTSPQVEWSWKWP